MRAPATVEAGSPLRTVSADEVLFGYVLDPRTGSRRLELGSLAAVVDFLQPRDLDELLQAGVRASVNYVDLGVLAGWIRDVLGDVHLAEQVLAIAERGEPFGLVAGEVKECLAARLQQLSGTASEPTE